MQDSTTHTHAMELELVLITGMSGSGKSVALHAVEDAGYYSVDNLPPELLLSFVELQQKRQSKRVAIAMDVRSAKSLPQVPERLRALADMGVVDQVAVPRLDHRHPGAPLFRIPAQASAVANRQPTTTSPTTSGALWSKPSNSSANCWPTCASTRMSSTPA